MSIPKPNKAIFNNNKNSNNDQKNSSENTSSEWKIDPRTNVKYRALPETEWTDKENGMSKCHLDPDVDGFHDLDSLASQYLPHLQVTPSSKEKAELRRKKFIQEKEQNEKYSVIQQKELEEDVIKEQEAEELIKKRDKKFNF